MGLFRDRFKENAQTAHYVRGVERMKGPAGRAKSAPPPRPCGRACGYLPNGQGCPSTVRGGVCPCRYC